MLAGIWPSTLYCQTDSLKCFTVLQQKELILKLINEKALTKENSLLKDRILIKDSIIGTKEAVISSQEDKFELLDILYAEQNKVLQEAKDELIRKDNKIKIWRGTTFLATGAGILFYLLHL